MSAGRRIGERLKARPRLGLALAGAALALLVAVAVRLAVTGTPPSAQPRGQYLAAGRAYDEGRTREAAVIYESLLRGGHPALEVFYNLGNAQAREGLVGAAVLSYRKAWRLAPRDPDVAANLRLALRATGASEADLSGAELVFTRLSEGEWAAAAMAAWWATGLLLSLGLLFRRQRSLLLRLGALPAALTLVALLGLWTWRGFDRAPELVVMGESRNALASPQDAASPRFSLPEGSLVRAREFQGAWVRVSYGQLSGWLPRAGCEPVLLAAPQK